MRLNMASLTSKPESFLGSFYKVILDLDVAVGLYEGLGLAVQLARTGSCC
jgi:hypothetical protein